MAAHIVEQYNYYIYEKMDSRVKGWFLMDSPLPLLLIIASYLMFVKWLGPLFMKGKAPYNVDKAMLLYNSVQIIINFHFVYEGLKYLWIPGHYSMVCQEVVYERNFVEDKVVAKAYLFMWTRVLDFLDTVFMVLKKNKHQVTFLHVYHHILMAAGSWAFVKYLPGGQGMSIGSINCFVHTVMYFYYFLTAYDPSFKRSIWWKKQLTRLQLIQFVLITVQQCLALMSPTCIYPKPLLYFFLSQAIVMVYLFGQFYKATYVKKHK